MRGAQLGRLQPGRTVIPIATKRLYGSSASGESPNLVALDEPVRHQRGYPSRPRSHETDRIQRSTHLRHFIQYCNIDHTAVTDSLDLFRCFQDIVCRDDMPLQCVMMDLFIKCHVTVLVLFTAAAPAHVISSQFFHISSVPGLLTGLIQ